MSVSALSKENGLSNAKFGRRVVDVRPSAGIDPSQKVKSQGHRVIERAVGVGLLSYSSFVGLSRSL